MRKSRESSVTTPASTVTDAAAPGCSVHDGFPFSPQAVETNLASKDSHWVFVNEVGARRGRSLTGPPALWEGWG